MKLIDIESAEHYKWGKNCDSWKLVHEENISVKFERIPPLASEKLHIHSRSQQTFYILKGIAVFEVENKRHKVQSKQGILIDANEKHRIINETNSELDFLVISCPPTDNDRKEID